MKYTVRKSSAQIKSAGSSIKGGQNQEHSVSANSERRVHARRERPVDRRDLSMILRGHIRHERRRNDRRNVASTGHPPRASTELVNAPLDLPRSQEERSNAVCLWVVTDQADLSSQLQGGSTAISISQYNLKEIAHQDNVSVENYPHVILIDVRFSVDSVKEQLQMIREKMASARIILLTDKVLPNLINEIIEYHITGLLQIGIDHKLFEKAIHAVHRGEFWFSHQVMKQIFDTLSKRKNSLDNLMSRNILFTKCELQIIRLVIPGLSNKQIAQKLAVSPETIKKHLKSIFLKANVKSRIQLVSEYLLEADSLTDNDIRGK